MRSVLAGAAGSMAVFTLCGSVALGSDPPSYKDRHEPPKPVTVVNPPSKPVPVAVQGTTAVTGAVSIVGTPAVTGAVSIVGTPTVTGAVSITGTPTVTVGNDVLRVEVTNPSAPGGGSAVLAPTAASQLVDLVTNSGCPASSVPGAYAFDNEVRADGARGFFSQPADKSLIITDVSATFELGVGAAGHAVGVGLARASAQTYNLIDFRTVTVDANGVGFVTFSFGHGSRFQPGTSLCIRAQDRATAGFIVPFSLAHGFLAPDN